MPKVNDLGPLDWQVPIVDKQGRPSSEFQRRWNTQRGNNALIGSVTLGSGPPTGTPGDGAEYLDISVSPFVFYVGSAGTWHQAAARVFTDLADAPSAYTGAATKLVRVNPGASAVEFATVSAVLDGLGAVRGDVLYRGAAGWAALAPGTLGNVLTTGGAGADPAWAAAGGSTGANPTATASDVAVNGAATTFMRSDGAPAVQKASAAQFGLVKVDGTTITAAAGVISAVGGGGRNTEATWTTPAVANFPTSVNITRSSLSNGTNGLLVDFPGANANNELWLKSAPATPYDVCMRYAMFIDNSVTQAQFGLVLRNSVSGKIVILGEIAFSGSNILAQNWTNATTFSATIINTAFWPSGPSKWLRISNDGTNLNFYCSPDGWNWQLVATVQTLASFIASVDQVGFYAFAGAGTNYCRAVINSFGTAIPAP